MEDADVLNALSSSYEKVFDPAGHSWILVPPSSPVHPKDTGPRPPVTHPDALVGMVPHSLLGEGSVPVLDVPSPSNETGSLGSAADANSLPAGALPMHPAQPTPSLWTWQPSPVATPEFSPRHMSDSLLHEGESVAALAMSEILSPECSLLPPHGQPSMAASDASYDGRPPFAAPSEPPAMCAAPDESCTYEHEHLTKEPRGPARKYGVLQGITELAFPSAGAVAGPVAAAVAAAAAAAAAAPSKGGVEVSDDEEEYDSLDTALGMWWGPAPTSLVPWGRPLAIVAVLLASHAAVLLLGVAIGRQQHATASTQSTEPMLIRRFSSGPTGVHARLAWP
jgi:hypothetical protein